MTLIKAISSRAKCHVNNPNNLPNINKELVRRQRGLCPITGRDLRAMTPSNVVVDHNHKTGVIRAALPRGINGLEGKVKALLIRWGACKSEEEAISMLRGLADYLELHRTPQTEWIHPEHLTPAEQRAKKNKQARARYAKKKEK
ncbi:endonuclease VII [Vibrio phage D530]